MCDRIAILNKGNIVALDSTKNLLDRIQTKKVTFKTDKIINIKDEIKPDLIVAIGGGCVIDYSKISSVFNFSKNFKNK